MKSTHNGISSNVSRLSPEITHFGKCGELVAASGMMVRQSGGLSSCHVRGCGANLSPNRQGVEIYRWRTTNANRTYSDGSVVCRAARYLCTPRRSMTESGSCTSSYGICAARFSLSGLRCIYEPRPYAKSRLAVRWCNLDST